MSSAAVPFHQLSRDDKLEAVEVMYNKGRSQYFNTHKVSNNGIFHRMGLLIEGHHRLYGNYMNLSRFIGTDLYEFLTFIYKVMSTVFKGNSKKFSNKIQLDNYLEKIDVRGFGASNTLKECIKSLGRTKLMEQIDALQEQSNLPNLRFNVDETDQETLQKIALYFLNVYDVTYHAGKFTFIEIKHSMDDDNEGWFMVTRSTKKDVLAAEMYDDLKDGNDKYSDAQIIKDITALFKVHEGCLPALGLSLETITMIFRKKLFYVIIPVQLEELLKLSAVNKKNGKWSLHKLFEQMKTINARYSKTNDPHGIGYEVSYETEHTATEKDSTGTDPTITVLDNDDSDDDVDLTKEPHVVPPSPAAKAKGGATASDANSTENNAKRRPEDDPIDYLPKKRPTIENPYLGNKKGKNTVGQISAKSYGLKPGSFQKLTDQKALRGGNNDVQGRQKQFVISFSTPFRVGRSHFKVVMFVEGFDGTSSDNVMFLWKPRAVATAFMIEYYCKEEHFGRGRDHFHTVFKTLTEISLERKSPGSEENERRMVGSGSAYTVPILHGVFDIDDVNDINDENELKMKMTELAKAVEGILGHEQFFNTYDVGCHREFSFRNVEDMTEKHFEDNLNSKRLGFAAFVVKPASQKQINGFKRCKFNIKFDVCLDEKMVDEGITNALKLIYGESHDIPKSAFPAIFMNPSEKDANELME